MVCNGNRRMLFLYHYHIIMLSIISSISVCIGIVITQWLMLCLSLRQSSYSLKEFTRNFSATEPKQHPCGTRPQFRREAPIVGKSSLGPSSRSRSTYAFMCRGL